MPVALKRVLKLLVLGGATAVVLLYGRMELKIKGPFDVLPVHNADVRAGAEGLIEEIHVMEGQTVRQGELIASLFDREVRAELQKTEAAISQSQPCKPLSTLRKRRQPLRPRHPRPRRPGGRRGTVS